MFTVRPAAAAQAPMQDNSAQLQGGGNRADQQGQEPEQKRGWFSKWFRGI